MKNLYNKRFLILFIHFLLFSNSTLIGQTYTFTNAGASGSNGPTQAQIDASYSSTDLNGLVTINTQGIQEWTVPSTGNYIISGKGASGGYTPNALGGKGRVIEVEVTLTAGDIISVLVGQEGGRASFSSNYDGWSGGGGGGTFIINKTTGDPILICGGGGGAGEGNGDINSYWNNANLPGVDASLYNIQNGSEGLGFINSWACPGTGGVNGYGGNVSDVVGSCWPSNFYGGSGGGGFIGDGTQGYYGGYPGLSFTNGGTGGTNRNWYGAFNENIEGGFGGGAGAGIHQNYEANGGGGGGYSGGGGSATRVGAGGGGGNFYTGTFVSSGTNTGHGEVSITTSCPEITVDVTPYALDCFGYDYQLTINPIGGVAPYTITASGGTLSATEINGNPVQADTYVFLFDGFQTATYTTTITVVDADGCESGAIEVELTNPELVVAGSAVSTPASCPDAADGTITYSGQSGGTPHINNANFPDGWVYYLLGPQGEIQQGSPTFTGLAPGFYDVGAGDANGCGTGLISVEVLNGDNEAPTVTCSANINVCATSEAGAVLTYATPIATDNCGELTPVLVSGLESGSVFPIGETIVRYEATDASNNTMGCEFTVTVAPIPNVDPIDDIIVCAEADVSEIIFAGNLPDGQYTWTNDNPDIGLATSGSGNIASFTATNTSTAPITANITVTPATPDYLYMSTTGDNSVSVINTLTNAIVATVPIGNFPYGTSASLDGAKVYFTNRNDNSVSVIDTATNTLEATIDVFARPSGILASPDGSKVYVGVNNGVSGLAVINTSDNTVTEPALVGYIAPWGTAVSPDGTRLYATVGSTISVINTSDYSEIVNIPIPGGSNLFRYAISPDGSTLYVTDLSNNAVSVIDVDVVTMSYSVVETITVAAAPNAITISPDGSKVYVSIFAGTTVDVIDTADNTVSASIEVGPNHGGISVSSDGAFVYLARQGLSSVTVINTATNTVVTDIAVNSSTISYGNFVSNRNYCTVEPTTFSITVNNLPINTDGIIASTTDPIQAGTGFSLSADFNVDNLTAATWYFSDDGEINSPGDAELTFAGDISGGVVSGAFNFDATLTGVYTVKVVVEDACGTAEATYDYVVVYDPSGGFVTGGGWIDSPAGALVGTDYKGKANFGLVAKYKTGNNNVTLEGNTNFQFKEGDFHFKSNVYSEMSLVISGERKATYKGSGTVNGSGNFDFRVIVIDGEAPGAGPNDYDSFRIKIWTSGSHDDVVYDNEIGVAENADATTGLGGGQIVIHKPKGNNKSSAAVSTEKPTAEDVFDGLELVSWPNPTKEYFNILLKSKNNVDQISIQVYDLNGRMVSSKTGEPNKEYRIGTSFQAGLYFINVTQGGESKQIKLIKY